MKKTELLKFIEDEVNQIVKSEKSKPAAKKTEPAKPKELKEEDFDEVMFKRVNESKNIRKIISKIMKENYDFAGEEKAFWDKKYYEDDLEKEKNNLTKLNKSKRQYKIYNNSFSEACSEAIDFAKEKGYEVDEDDWFNKVSVGSKRPSEGNTNRYSIELKKDGKSQKKMLHFQVYGMKSGKYELNAYIN
jgi:hypothetical protein